MPFFAFGVRDWCHVADLVWACPLISSQVVVDHVQVEVLLESLDDLVLVDDCDTFEAVTQYSQVKDLNDRLSSQALITRLPKAVEHISLLVNLEIQDVLRVVELEELGHHFHQDVLPLVILLDHLALLAGENASHSVLVVLELYFGDMAIVTTIEHTTALGKLDHFCHICTVRVQRWQ